MLDASNSKSAHFKREVSNYQLIHEFQVLLDLIRWVAAMTVFVGHVRHLFFVDFSDVESAGFFIRMFYFLTGFGHEAVVVFFVLSGILITLSILRARAEGRFRWSLYFIDRLTRLEVVLFPGLVLGFFWDQLGMYLFGLEGIYGGSPLSGNLVSFSVEARSGAWIYLGNLAFLQNAIFETAGSNGPLWSLSYEMWCYLLFPLGLCFFTRKTSWKVRITFIGLVLLMVFNVKAVFWIWSLVWLMGSFITLLIVRKLIPCRLPIWVFIGSAFIFGLALFCSRIKLPLPMDISNLLFIGATFSALLAICYGMPGQLGSHYLKWEKLIRKLYTLYVVHLPLLVFLSAGILHNQRWQPSFMFFLAAVGAMLLVFCYAYLVSLVGESKTKLIRGGLKRSLFK